MVFTKDQMKELSQFEIPFKHRTESGWVEYLGKENLTKIHRIFCDATGDRRQLKLSCSTCWGNLIRDCAKIYFEDKEEMKKGKRKK